MPVAPGTRNAELRSAVLDAVDLRLGHTAGQDAIVRDPYALDPFKHLDEGHVWVIDLETMREAPLEAWPHQRELIKEWIDLDHLAEHGYPAFRTLHLEKSRQLGTTWIVAWVVLWCLTYHSIAGLAMSLHRDEVDDGGQSSTPDSFFGRVRFMWRHEKFPAARRAPLQFIGGNDPMIRNLARPQAYVVGEGATPDPGRGGKYGYGFLDEAARIPYGEAVQAALGRAIPAGRFYNSTPKGKDNLFYRLRKTRPLGYRFLRFHWSIHPLYGKGQHVAGERPETCRMCKGVAENLRWDPSNPRTHRYPGKLASPWYDGAVLDMTDEQVARELDIDYEASLTARVFPEWSSEVHVVDDLDYDKGSFPEIGMDFGGPGTTAAIICQDLPDSYRVIGEFETEGVRPDQFSEGLKGALADAGVPFDIAYDPQWRRKFYVVADPAGEARSTLDPSKTVAGEYRKLGWQIQSQRQLIDYTIRSGRRLLMGHPKPLRVSSRCVKFIEHIESNRWPTDREGAVKENANEPVNDRHNHMMRAWAYLVSHKFPPPEDPIVHHLEDWRADQSHRVDPSIRRDMAL